MALELQFRSCVHFHGNGKKINNSFSSGKFDHKTRYNSNPKRKQESTNGLSWGFMAQGGENDRESIRSVNYDRKMLWQMVAAKAHLVYRKIYRQTKYQSGFAVIYNNKDSMQF